MDPADLGVVPGLGYARPVTMRGLVRWDGDRAADASAAIAEEVPVALVYNGRSHVVVMASPADLEDLAVGFTLTEEIVVSVDDIRQVDVVRHSRGIELQLRIPDAFAAPLEDRRRGMSARTGCGLCGVEALDDVFRHGTRLHSELVVDPSALWRAGAALDEQQPFNHETHTVHAAAWATPDGVLRVVREDVGRHNALDKVLGALYRDATLRASEGFLVVTSRASYELVQKAALAGVVLLAAVSRPTQLAIAVADSVGLTLVGLLRGRSANVYSHPERLRVSVATAVAP